MKVGGKMAYDGTLKFDTAIDQKGFESGLKSIESSATKAGKALAPLSIGAGLIAGASLNAAIELEAMSAKYTTVFKGFTDVSDAFIEDFQKLTPATTAQAQAFASGIQDLLVPMGFAREEATGMTGELMHVIGALANFNSGTETAESVTQKFQGALTGEYDGLKSLGIQLDANTVKQKAVEMGLVSQGEEVTKQVAAQVLLQEAYRQSGDALTAYNEKNLDTKTKIELLKTELLDAGAKLMESFLPVLTDIVDGVRAGVEAFSNLPQPVQDAIGALTVLVAVASPLLLLIGSLAGAITNITALFAGFTPAVATATAATATAGAAATGAAGGVGLLGTAFAVISSPIALAIGAIAAIGLIIYGLWGDTEEFKNFWVSVWEKIKAAPGKAMDDIKADLAQWKEIGTKIVTGIFNGIKAGWQDIENWINDKFGWLDKKLNDWGLGGGTTKAQDAGLKPRVSGTYATGMSNISKDMTLTVHRGEKIVPANQSNADTQLLQQVVSELRELKRVTYNQPYVQRNILRTEGGR